MCPRPPRPRAGRSAAPRDAMVEPRDSAPGRMSSDLELLIPLARPNLRREVREATPTEAYAARALRGFNALGGRA